MKFDPQNQDFASILHEDLMELCPHGVAFLLHCNKCDEENKK